MDLIMFGKISWSYPTIVPVRLLVTKLIPIDGLTPLGGDWDEYSLSRVSKKPG
jgi:hypothetical protein